MFQQHLRLLIWSLPEVTPLPRPDRRCGAKNADSKQQAPHSPAEQQGPQRQRGQQQPRTFLRPLVGVLLIAFALLELYCEFQFRKQDIKVGVVHGHPYHLLRVRLPQGLHLQFRNHDGPVSILEKPTLRQWDWTAFRSAHRQNLQAMPTEQFRNGRRLFRFNPIRDPKNSPGLGPSTVQQFYCQL